MTLKPIALIWAGAIGLLPLAMNSLPVAAQTLVNPIPNRPEEADFYRLQRAIYQWVINDFRSSDRSLRGVQVEISSLVTAGDWATGIWMVSGSSYPEGIAGQVLMKQQGQRWVFVAGAGGEFGFEDFIRLGVPPGNAEGLAAGSDI